MLLYIPYICPHTTFLNYCIPISYGLGEKKVRFSMRFFNTVFGSVSYIALYNAATVLSLNTGKNKVPNFTAQDLKNKK